MERYSSISSHRLTDIRPSQSLKQSNHPTAPAASGYLAALGHPSLDSQALNARASAEDQGCVAWRKDSVGS